MNVDTEERIEKLPKWAQNYIEDLKCEIDRLEEECRDFVERISDYENVK